MAKIIESFIADGNKKTAYVEVRFANHVFVVYADGNAYKDGKPQRFVN